MLIKTRRLTLRRLTMDDLDLLIALESDPAVMRYIRECRPAAADRQEASEALQRELEYYDRFPGRGKLVVGLNETGTAIGWISLKHLDNTEIYELGYRYLPAYWGRGYATEAAMEMTRHAFQTVGLDRLAAIIHPENKASAVVLERSGFRWLRPDHFYGTVVDYYEAQPPDLLDE